MKSLKFQCLKFFRKELKNLIRAAYYQQESPESSPRKTTNKESLRPENAEIPFEQIEDTLFEEIAQTLKNDTNSYIRLIQSEKELLPRFVKDEEEFYSKQEVKRGEGNSGHNSKLKAKSILNI
jgi:hypothetical protein